eukprot:745798-Hanusia_phi.AAC.3
MQQAQESGFCYKEFFPVGCTDNPQRPSIHLLVSLRDPRAGGSCAGLTSTPTPPFPGPRRLQRSFRLPS